MRIFYTDTTLNSAFGAIVGKEVEEGKKLILGDPAKVSEAFIIGGMANPKGFRTPSFKTGNTKKRKRMGRGVVGGNVVKRDWIPEWAGSERGNKRRERPRKTFRDAVYSTHHRLPTGEFQEDPRDDKYLNSHARHFRAMKRALSGGEQ